MSENFFSTLKEWLQHHGFKNGANPFENLAAENFKGASAENAPDIGECLVHFDYIDEIQISATTFLFLPRGAGKSTIRLYLTKNCEDTLGKDAPKKRLPVTYIDFHRLIREENVTLQDHVDGILREAVPRLFEVALKYDRLQDISENSRYDLIWFLARYPDRLHAKAVQEQIQKAKGMSGSVSDREKKKLAATIWKKTGDALNQFFPGTALLGDALSALVGTPFEMEDIPKKERSPLELMECLYGIAKEIDIKTIYIFIDRIDEYCEIHDIHKAARMIRPLVETLPLLEMDGFAFKFFLPLEHRSELLQNLRSDRLNIYDSFVWEDSGLKEMLNRRLEGYLDNETVNKNGCQHLLGLFDAEDGFDETTLLNQMIQYADKSPRRLIWLAKCILDEHSKSATIPEKISKKTYERALGIFASNQMEWLSRENDRIEKLAMLKLWDRKPLEILLQEDFGVESGDISDYITRWRDEKKYESPHFSLTDIIIFLNVSKKKAQEIARQWEDGKLVTSHYRIADKGLAAYLHGNDKIEWLACNNEHIANLAKLKFHERKTLETLLAEEFKKESDVVAARIDKWRRDEQYESPHFSLTDVIQYLNIPKKEAQEIVCQWEDVNLVTSHFRIVNEGMSTYIHTKREIKH